MVARCAVGTTQATRKPEVKHTYVSTVKPPITPTITSILEVNEGMRAVTTAMMRPSTSIAPSSTKRSHHGRSRKFPCKMLEIIEACVITPDSISLKGVLR